MNRRGAGCSGRFPSGLAFLRGCSLRFFQIAAGRASVLDGRAVEKSRENRSSSSHQRPRGDGRHGCQRGLGPRCRRRVLRAAGSIAAAGTRARTLCGDGSEGADGALWPDSGAFS